ncbi:3'-5' exonuclease [Tunicatimonas pelagia]|uniref:3'-5' exonuclease n=1 Tax=Tunicatimonas pelagia TaxID=931531 RepID=UPI0026650A5D|nr:3'-5' exonuclease [Tunicatimonas pelagia]WKN43056.1 3'-5' exonuclease [Tunicatimonas pelagia]
MKWFRRSSLPATPPPDFIVQYQRASRAKLDTKQSIREIRFVVFDTETTGLNPQKDTWLSLGAVIVQQRAIWVDQSLEFTLRHQDVDISAQVAVHGITQNFLADGISEVEVLQRWLLFIENSVLVAHHAAFDQQIINEALRRHFGQYKVRLRNTVLDTAQLAQRLDRFNTIPEAQNPAHYSLDHLCQRFDIAPNDRHTAAGDALLTAQLLLKLLAQAEQRGVRTYRQLLG